MNTFFVIALGKKQTYSIYMLFLVQLWAYFRIVSE